MQHVPAAVTAAGGLLAALLLAPVASAGESFTIDFERDPEGIPLQEGTPLTSTYAEWGVEFYLVDAADEPFVAVAGWPRVALLAYSERWRVSYDVAASGTRTMTDGFSLSLDYGMTFSQPMQAVSLALIDFGDCNAVPLGTPVTALLEAYDAQGVLVDSDTFTVERFSNAMAEDGNIATLSVQGEGIVRVETVGVSGDCGTAIDDVVLTPGEVDADGDGVLDDADACPDTAPRQVVDAEGCSIADRCPCDHDWRNHGRYVQCVAQVAQDFAEQGLIGPAGHGFTVSSAARSECGQPR